MSSEDWVDYAENLHPQLIKYIETHSSYEVTNFLKIAYGFFAFHSEKISNGAKKNVEYLGIAGIFLHFMHDNFRSLALLHSLMHLTPIAMVYRGMFESLSNFIYILEKPEIRFNDYYLYLEIERFNARNPDGSSFLDKSELDRIQNLCSKWFYKNKRGELRTINHWTADKEMSLKRICEAIGFSYEYQITYQQASLYVHCSSILKNVYKDEQGVTSIPISKSRDQLALLACNYGVRFILESREFFGIPVPNKDEHEITSLYLNILKKNKLSSK